MQNYICIAVLIFLAGCGNSYHKEDWYIQHDAEREARIKECENDPAQYLNKDSDCLNAKDARAGIFLFGGKEGALKELARK
jgi:hypothetical protein